MKAIRQVSWATSVGTSRAPVRAWRVRRFLVGQQTDQGLEVVPQGMLLVGTSVALARPAWTLDARDLTTVRAGGLPLNEPVLAKPRPTRAKRLAEAKASTQAERGGIPDPVVYYWVPFQEVRRLRCRRMSSNRWWSVPLNFFFVMFAFIGLLFGESGPSGELVDEHGPIIRLKIWTSRGKYRLEITRRQGDGLTRSSVAQLRHELRLRSGLR